jgi:hypothetical protein
LSITSSVWALSRDLSLSQFELTDIRKNLKEDVFGFDITVRAFCRKVLKSSGNTKELIVVVWVIWVNGNLFSPLKT